MSAYKSIGMDCRYRKECVEPYFAHTSRERIWVHEPYTRHKQNIQVVKEGPLLIDMKKNLMVKGDREAPRVTTREEPLECTQILWNAY